MARLAVGSRGWHSGPSLTPGWCVDAPRYGWPAAPTTHYRWRATGPRTGR